MRVRLLLLALLAAAGCRSEVEGTPVSLIAAGTVVTSYAVLQRSPIDAIYSLVVGKDCSSLHLERRGEYCRTRAAVTPPPFCTRSLASVDCWTETQPYGPQRPVADTPVRPEVEAAPWPPI
ncbi:hypothetical protein [Elioraea sp.]|uniref:hypothetical protein n=1 Tax=Elioraea sp. TaxID=2185103 RepID=UPI003F72CA42